MKTFFKISVLFLLQMMFCTGAFAQGSTAFSYQGQLNFNGTPANGGFDFQFGLFDAPTVGNQLGSSLSVTNLSVTNGLFTTSIDFGPGVFNGAARWLQVGVRPYNTSTFTNVGPRIQILPVPYAVYAATAAVAASATNATSASSAAAATNATNFSGTLAGDVTGTQKTTVVSSVGGQSAANVAAGSLLANQASTNNVANTIVKRDPGGSFSAGAISMSGILQLSGATQTILTHSNQLLFSDLNGNFFVGSGAGTTNYAGVSGENLAAGASALTALTTGNFNTAVGAYAGNTTTTASENTAVGAVAMVNGGAGGNNIALGYQAGYYTTGGGNIDIGHPGFAGENNIIRIGTPGVQTDTYLSGIVHAEDLQVSTTGTLAAEISSSSKIGCWFNLSDSGGGTNWTMICTGSGNGEGAGKLLFSSGPAPGSVNPSTLTLTPSGSVGIGNVTSPSAPLQVMNAKCDGNNWLNTSDRNLKEGFAPINSRAVLDKVASLSITEWKYKTEAEGIKHLGPVAQDFMAAFNLGNSDKMIGTGDESGVALAAIQGLNEKLQEKDTKIEQLEQRLERMEKLLSELQEKR